MAKTVIPFQFDLPDGHPLLSDNAGVVQKALARLEEIVGDAFGEDEDRPVPTIAIWPVHGTHRRTTTDRESA